MEYKKTLIIILMGVFLFSFASAVECDVWNTFQQNTNISLIQKCPSCSYVNITSITYPNGTVFLNDAMTNNGINYNYTLPDSSQVGIISYGTIGDKNGASPPNYEELCIEITTTGIVLSLWDSLVRIFLIIFFMCLLAGTYHVVADIDFKKWEKGIVEKYKTRNFVKMVLAIITYNIMNNVFIIYYLLGLPIILILNDLTHTYNIAGLVLFMQVLLSVYVIGILIVGIVFLSYVQEWAAEMLDLVRDMDWGIEDWGGKNK